MLTDPLVAVAILGPRNYTLACVSQECRYVCEYVRILSRELRFLDNFALGDISLFYRRRVHVLLEFLC